MAKSFIFNGPVSKHRKTAEFIRATGNFKYMFARDLAYKTSVENKAKH
jgi:hypothetical protein